MRFRWLYLLFLLFLALSLVSFLFFFVHKHAAGENTPKIAYIDVGHANSALIWDPGDADILIDGGRPGAKLVALPVVLRQVPATTPLPSTTPAPIPTKSTPPPPD